MEPETHGGRATRQLRRDTGLWTTRELVAIRADRDLREAEGVLLERYRSTFAGRVLELGCGSGRLTSHLAALGGTVLGIDSSPRLIELCRRSHGAAAFEVGDLRLVSAFGARGRFDAVMATDGIIDALDHAARERLMRDVADLLTADGVFIFSSRNLAHAPLLPGPLAAVRGDGGAETLRRLVRVPQWIYNHRRMRRQEIRMDGYALLNDPAHDFERLHHYISRDAEVAELARAGLSLLECIDQRARTVPPGEGAPESAALYYVARRAASI